MRNISKKQSFHRQHVRNITGNFYKRHFQYISICFRYWSLKTYTTSVSYSWHKSWWTGRLRKVAVTALRLAVSQLKLCTFRDSTIKLHSPPSPPGPPGTADLPMQLQAVQGAPLLPDINVFSHCAIPTARNEFKNWNLCTSGMTGA